MKQHRWSGWPGAYCLDCFAEDPVEVALADGYFDCDKEDGCTCSLDRQFSCLYFNVHFTTPILETECPGRAPQNP